MVNKFEALGSVFLAEDDDDMRALLATTLRGDGYEIHEARNGTELLELLAQATSAARPDVIITDVLMPGYSGIGILAAVRGAGWKTPVILITARRDSELRSDAENLGVTAYLQKPFDVADLRVAVLAAMRS